jgi:hypothetical protein
MDPYFDPKKSSSSVIKSCGASQKCLFKQSYSEGSSWQAFKVKDVVYIGAESNGQIPIATKYTVNFEFGCQSSETGLFRTQHVDGIMGFSSMADTLPHQLVSQKITKSKLFAMCFRVGGGALTLGGFDEKLHRQGASVQYANLVKSSGWFTVRLLDILMKDSKTGKLKSIGENPAKYNTGKGAIVDSGTTDTYLPNAVRNSFQSLFNSMSSGIKYSNNKIILSDEKLQSLPTIVYRIAGKYGEYIDVECPPTSYAESLKQDKPGSNVVEKAYAFRIYLSEGSGTVLGANFMNDHNVLFDIDQGRIGFAESRCKLDNVGDSLETSSVSVPAPVVDNEMTGMNDGILNVEMTPESGALIAAYKASINVCFPKLLSSCSAKCDADNNSTETVVFGVQTWGPNPCSSNGILGLIAKRPWTEECAATCSTFGISENPIFGACVNSTWSACSSSCIQTRRVNRQSINGTCTIGILETRPCAVFECPVKRNDFIVSMDLIISSTSAYQYSPLQTEELFRSLSELLKVGPWENAVLYHAVIPVFGFR